MTGVDRVEFAYLRALLAGDVPCFGVVRTVLGLVLLDRNGMAEVADLAGGRKVPGRPDLLGRLTRRHPARAWAEAAVRRVAVARAPMVLAAAMLRRWLPRGTDYLNVGHSNLSARMIGAVRRGLGGKVTILVHDTIPLDHPEFSRPGIPEVFARKMQVVAREADLVVFTTEVAQAAAAEHFQRLGRVPPAVVAGLGVEEVVAGEVPAGLGVREPFFLVLGTIEARKNHGFLLDLWEEMSVKLPAGEVPQLVIAGSRGWRNAEVFRRLDASPLRGDRILECPDLPDAVVAGLMDRCAALLFPTRAEGFGLPALEAAARGCPVICTPLPVFREILGDYPVYLSLDDRYSWLETISATTRTGRQAEGADEAGRQGHAFPGWSAHFDRALNLT